MTKNTEFNLWHYTTAEGLKGILSNQTLWATDYRYLNDSLEFIYSKMFFRQSLLPKVISTMEGRCRINPNVKKLVEFNGGIQNIADFEVATMTNLLFESMLNPLNTPQQIPFVLSFCKMPKDDSEESRFLQKNGLLSQWRGYGKDGGYAIIFDLEKIINGFEKENNSFCYGIPAHDEVVYETDKLNVAPNMKKCLDIIVEYAHKAYESRPFVEKPPLLENKEIGALFECMAFMKHKGFNEENEYRICFIPLSEQLPDDPQKQVKEIKIRNNGGTLVPYIELFKSQENLPIKGIRVGPHREKEARVKSIKTYLSGIGLGNVEVFSSDIPYIGSR